MMELLYFFIAQNIFWGIISFKFYTAANKPAWQAFVPFYNLYLLLDLADRPKWWFILFLIPVVGTIMTVVVLYELLHMYGFRKTWQTAAVVLTFGLYLGYLNFTEKIVRGTRDNAYIKSNLGEMVNAIFFAVVAATIIRSTTFEAYTIPTSSMEKSLMIGDFLFVSKLHYGVRLPMTPVSIPLVHNKIPLTNIQSYFEFPSIPYFRFPAFQKVKNNDIVVFNYPVDALPPVENDGTYSNEVQYPPIDKKENYVKRCIAIAGDSLQIIDRKTYVNGKEQLLPDRSLGMFRYIIQVSGTPLNKKEIKDKFDLNLVISNHDYQDGDIGMPAALNPQRNLVQQKFTYAAFIPTKKLQAFKQLPNIDTIFPYPNEVRQDIFPNPKGVHDSIVFKYTIDDYGPIYIPKKGATVALNYKNALFYKEVITLYEGHTFEEKEGQYFVDGTPATEYTFEQNYYWMMGDNRHNSLDSRFWGYVPEDHIVGKPVFIWMSYDKHATGTKKIRTDRVFTTVHGNGPRKSYFWPVAIIALILYGANTYRKKKKKEKAKA